MPGGGGGGGRGAEGEERPRELEMVQGTYAPLSGDQSTSAGGTGGAGPAHGAGGRGERLALEDRILELFDVQRPSFNTLVGVVVITNAVFIGLETDLGADRFVVVEHFFVVFFFFEMSLRIRQQGLHHYVTDGWCLFDASLLAIGVLDLWILPLVTLGKRGSGGFSHLTTLRLLRLMRILRLLRVLRILRLFSFFTTLIMLTRAIGKAFQVVCSLGVLVAVMDYVFAIFLTQVVGQHAEDWASVGKQALIEKWFGNIGASMRTLFDIMTLDEWSDVVVALSEVLPSFPIFIFFTSYIVFAAYTLVCMVTALLSSQLIQAQQDSKEQRLHKVEELRNLIANDLRTLIQEGHDSPLIEAAYLKEIVDDDHMLITKLEEVDIRITKDGVHFLIDQLVIDDYVSIDYFVEKLVNLSGSAKSASVVDLKHLTVHGRVQILQLQDNIAHLDKKWSRDLEKLHKKLDLLAAARAAQEASQPTSAKQMEA